MRGPHTENDLVFQFGDSWEDEEVETYDKTTFHCKLTNVPTGIKFAEDDETASPAGIRMKDLRSKGVDFIFRQLDRPITLLEIKDHRRRSDPIPENLIEKICTEVARKFRDSLLGIIAANRTDRSTSISWETFSADIGNRNKDLNLIFWFQDTCHSPYENGRAQTRRALILRTLKKYCAHLTPYIFLVDLNNYTDFIDDLSVADTYTTSS